MMLDKKWGDSLALFTGIMLTGAFAPFSLFPLAIISIAVLLVLFLDISPKRAFWRGWLFGLGLFGTGVSWVFISIHTFGNASVGLAFLITAFFVGVLALFPALSGYLLNRYFPYPSDAKILYAFPAIWVLLEWVRSWIFTGFPWLNLGDTQINSVLRGYAPILSVYGVTFAVLLCSSTLVNAYFKLKAKHYKQFYFNMMHFAMIWMIGAVLCMVSWTKPEGTPIKVSLIQGNIPQEMKWHEDQVLPTLNQYLDLTRQHWNSQLIVWPESAIPLTLQDAKPFVDQLAREAQLHHTAILTGITVKHGEDNYYNAVIAIGDHTEDFYLKRRLVPFGEFTPLPIILEKMMKKFDIPMSNLIADTDKIKPIDANGLKISTFICYEIAFAEQVLSGNANIDLLLSVNNDAWFGKSIALAQHLEMGQMRALEMGRPLLFVSNTGLTAFIDSKGKIQSQAPPFQPYVLTDLVQKMKGKTPWQRHALDPLLILSFIFLIRSAWIQKKLYKKAR